MQAVRTYEMGVKHKHCLLMAPCSGGDGLEVPCAAAGPAKELEVGAHTLVNAKAPSRHTHLLGVCGDRATA
jgi:hypothetical protein